MRVSQIVEVGAMIYYGGALELVISVEDDINLSCYSKRTYVKVSVLTDAGERKTYDILKDLSQSCLFSREL